MNEQKDYYRILQIDPFAEQEIIEVAYKRLARKYHPDTNPSSDAKRRMQELNEAYEVLRGSTRRAEYDRARVKSSEHARAESKTPHESNSGTASPPRPEPEANTAPPPKSATTTRPRDLGWIKWLIALGIGVLLIWFGLGPNGLLRLFSATPTPTSIALKGQASPTFTLILPTFTAIPPTPPPFAVTNAAAFVSPNSSTTCPETFNFTGTLTASGAGNMIYQWIRSDGAIGPVQVLTFPSAGTQNVAPESWTLGAPGFFFNGWEQIQVLIPNITTSPQANFTLNCPPPRPPSFTPRPPTLTSRPPTFTPTESNTPPPPTKVMVPTSTRTPTFVAQPPARLVAFSSERSGNGDIYLMDDTGNIIRQLTEDPAKDDDPVPSRDGKWIAFTSFRNGVNGEIYRVHPDGSGLQRLTQNAAGNYGASWSPNNSQIVFYSLRDDGKQIYVMNADGSNQHRISTPDDIGYTDDSEPAWSPNGEWIAYNAIPHKKYGGDGQNDDIFIIDSTGDNKRNLTNSRGISDEAPNWSPDGRIVFQSNRNGNYDIFVMDQNGSNQQQLTNSAGDDQYPAWSSDGHFIVFYSNRDGNDEIYVMDANGSNQRRLAFDNASDKYPNWLLPN